MMNKLHKIALLIVVISIQSYVQGQTIIGSLDRAGMQSVINTDSDKPRIITILGVNCPACLAHRNDFKNSIMAQCDNPDLRWIILWFEDQFHNGDSLDAVGEATLVTDPRVSQYWCPEIATSPAWMDSVAYIFGGASWSGCNYFWDASILYVAGNTWSGIDPPAPDYCTAKVSPCCNLYSWSNFKADMDARGICSSGVGQDELSLEPFFIINYPNPSDGLFTCSYSTGLNCSSTLRFTDATGRLVKEVQLLDSVNEISIDIRDFEKGTYICTIKCDNVILKSERIVVR